MLIYLKLSKRFIKWTERRGEKQEDIGIGNFKVFMQPISREIKVGLVLTFV